MKFENFNIQGVCDECLDRKEVVFIQAEYGLKYMYICNDCLKELKNKIDIYLSEIEMVEFLKRLKEN